MTMWATNKQRKKAAAAALFDHLQGKGLTRREIEVVQVSLTAGANKNTAEKLFVDEKTVKFHLTNINKKMGLASRYEVLKYCFSFMMDRM